MGPERWLEFLAKTGIESSVLYPTAGLSYGQVHFPEWAAAYAQAYNDWFAEKYIKVSDRFKGVALIPVQDVKAAVKELRRAVKDLGMVCAMLPSNGLDRHYGSDEFNPLYEEAEKLDCALAVHGGCYGDLGFNSFKVFPATRALGMPFPLAIHMTGMMSEGVFDRFPELRVGFLEGGTAWIPLVLDRLNREVEYGGLQLKKDPIEYFRSGKVFVGCEGNETCWSTASTGSVTRSSCSAPTSRTRSPWTTAWRRSTRSATGKSSRTSRSRPSSATTRGTSTRSDASAAGRATPFPPLDAPVAKGYHEYVPVGRTIVSLTLRSLREGKPTEIVVQKRIVPCSTPFAVRAQGVWP